MLADKIKTLEKEKGISVCQIEKDCHIASGSIYKWNQISPSWDKIQAVASRLGVDVNELATRK